MTAIAIDGPAGAGKSTIARLAAKKLGFIYVDTGALYRAIAYNAVKLGVKISDETQVECLLDHTDVQLKFQNGEQRVYVNGSDVTGFIRTPEVSMASSGISALPVVRKYLLGLQRGIAKNSDVIMDGRDIGTGVLPDAKIKIFLTASAECRAKRRYEELTEKGMDVVYDDILRDIETRDYNDSHREVAPLKPARDAVLVDTSGETLETSLERLLGVIEKRL